jgi:hypothetical protein
MGTGVTTYSVYIDAHTCPHIFLLNIDQYVEMTVKWKNECEVSLMMASWAEV